MKSFPLFAFALAALISTSTAQNTPPLVTNQLPDVQLQSGAAEYFVDGTTGFRDSDVSNAVRVGTVSGAFNIALYGEQKPITVANFLRYVNDGRYFTTDPTTGQQAPMFIHRSAPNFVIQGGGWLATVDPAASSFIRATQVISYGAIQNEPGISNKRGTIAMAKLGGDPNSATSQWFINLADNSAGLDAQNGGFTVFGRIPGDGMSVVDAIAALPRWNFGAPFDELPLIDYTSPNRIRPENLVRVPEIAEIVPLVFSAGSNNEGVATARVSGKNILIKPGSPGVARITVTATDLDGASVSQSFNVNVISGPGRLANISTRGFVGTQDNVLIAGFIIRGTSPKRVLIRVQGPNLARYKVAGALADPMVSVVDQRTNQTLATNDNWQNSPDRQTFIDYDLAPALPEECAVLLTLNATPDGAPYTAVVRGVNETTGVGLVEVFDVDSAPTSFLENISTRGRVQTDDEQMIAGMIVRGGESKRVLVRAVGPSLSPYGVPDVLQNPVLRLYDVNGNLIRENDDWKTTQETEIRNTNHEPMFDVESALIEILAPGNYTAIVSGKDRTVGNGLVEVFTLN